MSFFNTKVPDFDFLIENSKSRGNLKKIFSNINDGMLIQSNRGRFSFSMKISNIDCKNHKDFISTFYKKLRYKVSFTQKHSYSVLTITWGIEQTNNLSTQSYNTTYTNTTYNNNINKNLVNMSQKYNGNGHSNTSSTSSVYDDSEILGL